MSLSIKCKNCRRKVPSNPRIKNHQYCNRKPCQNARKAQWQRQKKRNDPAYRQGQEECNDAWLQNNPDYWKNYRENHPEYAQRNRELQKQRDRKRRENKLEINESIAPLRQMDASGVAPRKMDASSIINSIITGGCTIASSNLAKMDASDGKNAVNPAVYLIFSENADLAKMDASKQQFIIIPVSCIHLAKMDNMDFR